MYELIFFQFVNNRMLLLLNELKGKSNHNESRFVLAMNMQAEFSLTMNSYRTYVESSPKTTMDFINDKFVLFADKRTRNWYRTARYNRISGKPPQNPNATKPLFGWVG